MRAIVISMLATVGIATGCTDSPADWPAPPADAVASCHYAASPVIGAPTGALYYDAEERVLRADGLYYAENGDVTRTAWNFAYDQGRLAYIQYLDHQIAYVYGDQVITSTDDNGNEFDYTLAGELLTRWEGPMSLPEGQRNLSAYEYNSAGIITRVSGATLYDLGDGRGVQVGRFDYHYTYDAKGRLATTVSGPYSSTVTYTESAGQLDVEVRVTEAEGQIETYPPRHWALSYDDQGRLTRIVTDNGHGTSTFAYADDEIVETVTDRAPDQTITATGHCPQPKLEFAESSGYPLQWNAEMVQQHYTSGYESYLFADVQWD